MWSSPSAISTPPLALVPAILAWRIASPERSTPGPLPYHRPNTPSYLPSPRSSACWVPQCAVAARSSFSPDWKVTLFSVRCFSARCICISTAPNGDPRYPVTYPAVFRPTALSRALWFSINRTNACVPFNRTVSQSRLYLSSRLTGFMVMRVPPSHMIVAQY